MIYLSRYGKTFHTLSRIYYRSEDFDFHILAFAPPFPPPCSSRVVRAATRIKKMFFHTSFSEFRNPFWESFRNKVIKLPKIDLQNLGFEYEILPKTIEYISQNVFVFIS